MNKIKRVAKRFTAGILSIITCISIFIVSPGSSLIANATPDSGSTSASYDAEGAKATAGAMMQNFANGGEAELKISDITESEFRTWAILLSNFFVPFHTDILNLRTENVKMYTDGKEKDYSTWKTFKSVWRENSGGSDTELLGDLLDRYENTVKNNAKALYIGGNMYNTTSDSVDNKYKVDGESNKAKLGYIFTLSSINYGGWYLYWLDENAEDTFENRHIVFSVPLDDDAGYAARALLACVRSMDTDGTQFLTTDVDSNKERKNIDSRLYVTPFGDIVCNYNTDDSYDKVACIIPACLNPFTFNNICLDAKDEEAVINGSNLDIKLYINNIFGLSNFVQSQDLTNKGISDGEEALFKPNENSGGLGGSALQLNDKCAKKSYLLTSNTGWNRNMLAASAHIGKMITLASHVEDASNNGKYVNGAEFYAVNQEDYNAANKFITWLGKKYGIFANSYWRFGYINGGSDSFAYKPSNKIDFISYAYKSKDSDTWCGTLSGVEKTYDWGYKVNQYYNYINKTLFYTGSEREYDNSWKRHTNTDYSKVGVEKNKVFDKIFGTSADDVNNRNILDKIKNNNTVFTNSVRYVQPYWSIKAQSLISDSANAGAGYKIGSNSFAIVGRSSNLDVKKEYKFDSSIIKNLITETGGVSKIQEATTYKNARGEGNDNGGYEDVGNLLADIKYKVNSNGINLLNKYEAKDKDVYIKPGDLVIDGGSAGSKVYAVVDSTDKFEKSEGETNFLSIYLGSLYKDPNVLESVRNRAANLKDDVYLLWWCLYDGTDSKNNEFDYNTINRIVNFQVPIDRVYSKLGVFKTGINMQVADNQTASSYANNFGIYTVNYATDLSEENTVMKKIHSGFNKANGYTTLPESLYVLNTLDIRTKQSYTLQADAVDASNKYSAWYYSYNRNLFANIYWAYIEDIVGIEASDLGKVLNGEKEDVTRNLSKSKFAHLPSMDTDGFRNENIFGLVSEDDKETQKEIANSELEAKQASIVDWVYKILSVGDTINNIGDIVAEKATAAGQYVIGWLKGMIDSLFIGWNNYMLGVDVSAGVTGSVSNVGNSTKSKTYSTAMGYMTTPTFSNLPITSWIMSNFQLIYVIIMILVVVILIMMILTRTRRLPQAILIFICMAFIIVLPANMLNGAIGISNNFTESVYANKFQYWAISQHAEYLKGVSYSQNQTSANLYDNLNRQDESSAGGVTLKWMAPKKWGIAEQIKAAAKNTDGLKLFLRFAGDRIDAEDFSDYTPGDTYLYRPYYGIYVEAYNLWNAIKSEDKTANIKLTDLGKRINNLWFNGSSSKEYKVSADMKSGQANSGAQNVEKKSGEVKIRNSNFFRYTSARGDSIMRSAIGGTGIGHGSTGMMTYQNPYFDSYYKDSRVIKDIQPEFGSQGRIYAMYSDINLISALFYFNKDNTLFNESNEPCGIWLYKSKSSSSNTVKTDGSSEKNYTTGINTYFDYSESPYYYFYNALADLKVKADNGSYVYGNTDFVDLILRDETFKVTNQQSKAYGELKDYLDLEGLFSYVIPLLNQGNQNAQQYFDKYGQTIDRTDPIFSNSTITERYDSTEESSTESSQAYEGKTVELKEKLTINLGDRVKIVARKKIDGGKEPYKYYSYYKKSSSDKWTKLDDGTTNLSNKAITLKKTGTYNIRVDTKDSNGKTLTEYSEVTVKEVTSSQSSNTDNTSSSGFKTYRTEGEDLYSKYEQQLQAIWNMYSPWVAQMIAANNKSEKVRSGFGYVELLEPWNPADYRYFGREMAFSPADATVHGYRDYDLSTVETKLHKVLEETYYDILDLVNYKDYTMVSSEYGSHVLISAAAMCATFNFNKEFSDNGFMSTDTTLYPQSYELKNMNFDAYLRIILGNSMGVNPVTMKNSDYSGSLTIYEEFIHNTSVWSGLVLVAEDFLAIFVVPLLKIMLIVVIFVLALALAVSCIINKPDKMIKVFLSTFIAPLAGMTAIFMAHSLVISWFIGDGLGSNVVDTHSISVTTGDPTLTLLLMIVVDLVTSILMWKLLKFAAKSTAKYMQDIGNGIAALGKGTFSGVAKLITAAAGIGTAAVGAASLAGGAIKSTASGVVGAGKAVSHKVENSRQTKLDKERNKLLKSGGKDGSSDKTKGKTSGSSGAGAGASNKPTNNNNLQQTNSSLAADVKAIRQKLEKGFNPEGMKQESSKQAEAKEEPKKVQAASTEASKAEKKPSAGAQKAQQLYKRKLTRKETQAAAMQSAMTGDNAGLKQAQADLDKLIAEQNALVSKYGATWNKGKKKFTSKSNNAEQNRQLNEMQRKINASRATVNTLKQKAETAKSSASGSRKQPRKVMKIKK